jgi:two-component system chemotaxis sensor kinase CheA
VRFRDVAWQFDDERTLFVEEATELLAALEEGALAEPPAVDALFRAAHTLKGSGGMIGLTHWVEAVHALETALDAVRQGHRPFDADLRRSVLTTVDALRAELAGEAPPTPKDAAPIPEPSPAPSGAGIGGVPAGEGGGPGGAEDALGRDAVAWTLVWAPEEPMPGVRAYQAWEAAARVAPGTASDPPPDRLPAWTGRESRLWVPASADPAAVRAALGAIDGLVRVEEPRAADGGAFAPAASAPDASTPAAGPTSPGTGTRRRETTVRVSAETLERVLEGLGELLLDQSQLEHRFGPGADAHTRAVLTHMRNLALELQDATLRARMLPLDTLFRQYPRAVHDLAERLGKRIRLETRGGETELDRVVMDRLHEPLLHLLRNACDHGIEDPATRRRAGKPETGTIRLSAYAAQGHVHVVVEDDGAGIDWERLRARAARAGWMTSEEAAAAGQEALADVLFRPGVSTAERVTDLSGRGVGLDAVRAFLDAIHGTVQVDSAPGRGTRMHLELPMTMAIMTALLVDAGPWTVGLPILAVERIEERGQAQVASILGQAAISDGGLPLPVYPLATLLEAQAATSPSFLVRVRDGRTRAALAVDRVRGQQEVVVKPVPVLAGLAPWMTGVALLGDGRLALMLDVRRVVPAVAGEASPGADDRVLRVGSNQMELLVFRLANGQRYGINVYKTREVLPAGPVTRVPNEHPWVEGFLRLRGQTVPVINIHRALGLSPPSDPPPLTLITEFNQTVQAFPVDAVERMVRVGWDQVEPLPPNLEAATPEGRRLTGLVDHPELGPIQLLDFEHILAQLVPSAGGEEGEAPPTFPGRAVWLADDSGVARRQVERALRPLGVRVRSFPDGQALWEALGAGAAAPDLFVLDVEMPRLDGYTLTQRLKRSPVGHVPVLLHTSLSGHWHAERVEQVGADALLTKFDPDLLAHTVADLLAKAAAPP